MNGSERTMVVVLRVSAVILMTALVPAVMPFAWMETIHRQLGMGELPEGPIVGYLTRSVSAFYAMHGVLVWFVSLDVRRYRPVIRCLAVLAALFGSGMIVLDWAVGMPTWWLLAEGPFLILIGAILLILAGKVPVRTEPPAGPNPSV